MIHVFKDGSNCRGGNGLKGETFRGLWQQCQPVAVALGQGGVVQMAIRGQIRDVFWRQC